MNSVLARGVQGTGYPPPPNGRPPNMGRPPNGRAPVNKTRSFNTAVGPAWASGFGGSGGSWF